MRLIELLGIPGSGKSTLRRHLEQQAAQAGIELNGLEAAARVAIAKSGADPISRTLARTIGRASSSVWKSALARSGDRVEVLSHALSARPELAEHTISINRKHNDSADSTLVLQWLLNHFIAFQLAEEALANEQWLLVTEGFANRSISLFAAGSDSELGHDLKRYLELIPVPDVLVVVSTPLDICYDRLDKRGWTKRIADHPPERRRSFLERSSHIVDIAVTGLDESGSRIILTDGTSPSPPTASHVLEVIQSFDAEN